MAKKPEQQTVVQRVIAAMGEHFGLLESVVVANAKADEFFKEQAAVLRAEYGEGAKWDKKVVADLTLQMQRLVAARAGDKRIGDDANARSVWMASYQTLNTLGKRERICVAGPNDSGDYDDGIEEAKDGKGTKYCTKLYFAKKVINRASVYVGRLRKYATTPTERTPGTPGSKLKDSASRTLSALAAWYKTATLVPEDHAKVKALAAALASKEIESLLAASEANRVEIDLGS